MSRVGEIRRQVLADDLQSKSQVWGQGTNDCFGVVGTVVQHQHNGVRRPYLSVQRDQAWPDPIGLIPNWYRNDNIIVIHDTPRVFPVR
jgi:hypothetical protein